jgi:hypothetical protein
MPKLCVIKQLAEFNFLPIRYIHDSWLEQIPNGTLVKKLIQYKKTHVHLSDYILESLDIKEHYCFDEMTGLKKIAWMSPDELEKLVCFAGAYLNYEALRNCIEGNSVRKIEQSIGREAYLFGLTRAPYLMQSMPVFEVKSKLCCELTTQIVASGMACLTATMEEYSKALWQRVAFKLPYSLVKSVGLVELVNDKHDIINLMQRVFDELPSE